VQLSETNYCAAAELVTDALLSMKYGVVAALAFY
jgi:hypothetical protein